MALEMHSAAMKAYGHEKTGPTLLRNDPVKESKLLSKPDTPILQFSKWADISSSNMFLGRPPNIAD